MVIFIAWKILNNYYPLLSNWDISGVIYKDYIFSFTFFSFIILLHNQVRADDLTITMTDYNVYMRKMCSL